MAIADMVSNVPRYMMQLDETKRKKSGERVIQPDLKSFRDNFNVFTEGALLNLGMTSGLCTTPCVR
jgi:hypothetical protein